MKKHIIFSIILILCFNGFSQNNEKTGFKGAIYFGSGFGNDEKADTINVQINGVTIYENHILFSDPYLGLAGETLKIISVNKNWCTITEFTDRVAGLGNVKKNTLNIEIIYKAKKYDYSVDLTDEKYIVISSRDNKLILEQYVNEPEFM